MIMQAKAAYKEKAFVRRWRQSGFTLVEMAIVMVIFGIVFAVAAQLYEQRLRFLRAENTKTAISNANQLLAEYVENFGRYPCPASLEAWPDSPVQAVRDLYGVESDCTDTTTVAPAGGVDPTEGYAVVWGERNVAYFDRTVNPPVRVPAAGEAPVRVRIGALPFKNLNMEESEAYDGYHQRLLYAVVEPLAVQKTFFASAGAIDVENEEDTSLLEPAASAHFIILSAGENGAGAYDRRGARRPCLATSEESENCNFEADAKFRFAETGTSDHGDAATYDDSISYRFEGDMPMWETSGPTGDALLKTVGDIGIGSVAAADHPAEDLQVDGTVIVRADSNGDKGQIEAETICEFTSGSTNCFTSEVIAGDLSNGKGLVCPPGQFMTGIQNGGAVCTNEIKVMCPSGYVTGIDNNGELICGTPPPGCPSTSKSVCTGGPTGILSAASHGELRTVTLPTDPGNPGGTRSLTFQCQNGTWAHYSTSGNSCSCTPQPPTPVQGPCEGGGGCNGTFDGYQIKTTSVECPSGQTKTTWDVSNCSCNPGGTKTYYYDCPSGFNKGRKSRKVNWTCSAQYTTIGYCVPETQSPIDDPNNPCRCEPEAPVSLTPVSCPLGLSGSIPQERQFVCPNGPDQPGTTTITPDATDPAVIAAHCGCSASPPYDDIRHDCPIGYSGTRTYTVTSTCDISDPLNPVVVTETLKSDDCVVDPLPPGTWTVVGGASGAVSPQVSLGAPCTLGETPPPRICMDGGTPKGCACQ